MQREVWPYLFSFLSHLSASSNVTKGMAGLVSLQTAAAFVGDLIIRMKICFLRQVNRGHLTFIKQQQSWHFKY